MSFKEVLKNYYDININEIVNNANSDEIENIINKDKINEYEFLLLLSDKSAPFIEKMALKSQKITIQNFGRVIQLYSPLYISDYCTNQCLYCGFNKKNIFKRKKLSLEEIEQNAILISQTGIKHILLLTGEAPEVTPLDYLVEAVRILKKYFASVSIEIFPMEIDEYKVLKNEGVDGLTIYQETYDRDVYDKVHLSGKKKDYDFRLETPERGILAGFHYVNIGPLYGLGDPLKDAFFCGLHAKYLQDKYLIADIGVSFPRLNEAEGNFKSENKLSDKKLVQFILAFRLFLPRVSIVISTRERAEMRDNLIPLGITRMSAGSKTTVGGYASNISESVPQFYIQDNRSVYEIVNVIKSKGYDPVFKDWDNI